MDPDRVDKMLILRLNAGRIPELNINRVWMESATAAAAAAQVNCSIYIQLHSRDVPLVHIVESVSECSNSSRTAVAAERFGTPSFGVKYPKEQLQLRSGGATTGSPRLGELVLPEILVIVCFLWGTL